MTERSYSNLAAGPKFGDHFSDSTLKFHFAYDPRNHQTNPEVSQQLFDSYPTAVRARLGILTRNYKVLSGSELIKLGIKDCNEPKTNEPKTGEPTIMVASAAGRKPPLAQPGVEKPLLAGLMDKMLSVFGAGEAAGALQRGPAPTPAPAWIVLAKAPLPPTRPTELAQSGSVAATQAPAETPGQWAAEPSGDAPPPPHWLAMAVDLWATQERYPQTHSSRPSLWLHEKKDKGTDSISN